MAEELAALDSPDEASFYTSGRTSNEAAFVYRLFVRALGTNNLPDCSNKCHESCGVALSETIGIGKGSVSLDDLHQADLVLVVGQNPGTNHPRMLSALERTKRGGGHVVAVNPLPEAGLLRFRNPQRPSGMLGRGTALADEFAQIRLGGDLALFRALNRLLLEAEDRAPGTVVDRAFAEEHTDGYEEFTADVRATPWADVLEATGPEREQIERIHQRVLKARKTAVCWAVGLTQHKHSVPTIREVVNFLLLRGNIGRPGAGVCPVRGHSNVQGDRTMGIYEKPADDFLDALEKEFGLPVPRHHGLDVVDTIRAMRDGRVKVFFAMGGNFVSATPDTAVTEQALRRTALTVQVSTKLNRSHLVTGRRALILPTLGRTETDMRGGGPQFVTVEDSMSSVHASRGTLAPASPDLRSETAIVCELAERVLAARGEPPRVPWRAMAEDYDLIRDRIARVVPGFEDVNRRVRHPKGFVLPHGPRDDRHFPTTTGKARFTVNPMTVLRVPEGRLLLRTIRSHDQYNTTLHGLDDRYRGIHGGHRVVFVHPDDLATLQLADADRVDLVGEYPDGAERVAPDFRGVSYSTSRGCCAAYFPGTNVLVPLDSTADHSNTPTSKSVVVRLVRRGTAGRAAARVTVPQRPPRPQKDLPEIPCQTDSSSPP